MIKTDPIRSDRALLIGIDGSDGSGKSFFARELAESLQQVGMNVAVCSIDDFHNKREIRYEKGRTSPIGFFEDSHNLEMLISGLLRPVINGKSKVVSKCFDCGLDRELVNYSDISSVNVVIFEGLFLNRDELTKFWDCSIFLNTDFSISVARGNARFGLNPDPEHETNAKYVKGNLIYRNRCNPLARADIVIDNNILESASIISNKYGLGTRSSPQP